MKTFWAWRGLKPKSKAILQQMQTSELTAGDVLVEVHYSSINYKDAMALTGTGAPILRKFPLTPGIDFSGQVLESQSPNFKVGDAVFAQGCNIGELYDGGFAEVARVNSASLMNLPEGLSLKDVMLIGTAGFTAALSIFRMEQNGQRPELGPILVTGATGGVGSFAIQLLKQRQYRVHALTGKPEAATYLKSLGAEVVLQRDDLKLGSKPLETPRFGGAIDNVGGELLSQILTHTELWGNVGAVGLVESAELNTTVMPFILRGVSLLGVSSNNTPMPIRRQVWRDLGSKDRPQSLNQTLARAIPLIEAMTAAEDLLNRRVQGRILIDVRGSK